MDFKNTVVIMTSNVGSQWIAESAPGQLSDVREAEVLRLVARGLSNRQMAHGGLRGH